MIENILATVVPLAVVSIVGAATYGMAKRKITAFRKFVDALDDALYDDKVSEQEFQALWERAKAILQ